MNYWRYRAYDTNLHVHEGVIVSTIANDDAAMADIILKLRQQGLQSFALTKTDHAEYLREQQIQRLKDRISSLTRAK